LTTRHCPPHGGDGDGNDGGKGGRGNDIDGRGRREEEKTAALCGAGISLPLGVRGAVCA